MDFIVFFVRFTTILLTVRRLLHNYFATGKVLNFHFKIFSCNNNIIFVGFRPDIAVGPELQSEVRYSKKIAVIISIYCSKSRQNVTAFFFNRLDLPREKSRFGVFLPEPSRFIASKGWEKLQSSQ